MPRSDGFTLVEMMVALLAVIVISVLLAGAGWKLYEQSSLAISANNIRVLSVGSVQYLADNNNRFWKFRTDAVTFTDADGGIVKGTQYWFGFETYASAGQGEGKRHLEPERSPLGPYIPASIRPDPSFAMRGSAFKPKYTNGYFGVGYNGVLGGGFSPKKSPMTYWELSDPGKVVVFATSAQVNTFQSPASSDHPMIEEFYLIDERETTVHFRHGKVAMVSYASGSVGFLPMDESTRDNRMPEANVGRFAPAGSFMYLK